MKADEFNQISDAIMLPVLKTLAPTLIDLRWIDRLPFGSAVLSCHCLVAVCGRPTRHVSINEQTWIQFLLQARYAPSEKN